MLAANHGILAACFRKHYADRFPETRRRDDLCQFPETATQPYPESGAIVRMLA